METMTDTELIAFLKQDIERYQYLVKHLYKNSCDQIMAVPSTLSDLEKANTRALIALLVIDILKDSKTREEAKSRIVSTHEGYAYAPNASIHGVQVFNAVIPRL